MAPASTTALPAARIGEHKRKQTRLIAALPQLSVVIVNYRHWEDTARLTRGLLAAPSAERGEAEVVVVDNHSPPSRLARRLRRWPGVSLRRWGRNRGFARAVNEGCRLSRGDWILLLNPDTSVNQNFLDEVLQLTSRFSSETPRTGIVGLQLRNEDGSLQHSAGPEPTLLRTLARLVLPRARRKYHFLPGRGSVPWVTGCGLLIRRDCWQQLGGLDEDFFLYYEDVDLCRRARAAGWDVRYEPSLSITHHRPLQVREVTPHLRVLTRHALLTFAAKHWPRWQFHVLTGIVRLEAWVRTCLAQRRGDSPAAARFQHLGTIVADLRQGGFDRARRRLHRLIRSEEAARA